MAFKPNKVNWHFALLLRRQSYFPYVRTSSIQFTTSDYPRDLSGIVPTRKVFLFIDSGRGELEAYPPYGTKRVNVNLKSLFLNINIKFYVYHYFCLISHQKSSYIFFNKNQKSFAWSCFWRCFHVLTHLQLQDKDFYPYFSMQYELYKII